MQSLIDRAFLILIPLTILTILWFSILGEGAPVRVYLISISPYAILSIVGFGLSLIKERYSRPTIILHLIWLPIYLVTAVSQQIALDANSSYPGDSRLSSLVWVMMYFIYAVIAPISAVTAWVVSGRLQQR